MNDHTEKTIGAGWVPGLMAVLLGLSANTSHSELDNKPERNPDKIHLRERAPEEAGREGKEESMVLRRQLRLALLPALPAPPNVSGPVFNSIDQFVAAQWEAAGLPEAKQPPELCEDAAFLRRVYLDVIGVVPTLAEAQEFFTDASTDKRARLVDRLLARHDDYAAHWTPFWEDALASQNVPQQGGIPTRGNYRDWIFNNFKTNKPYDVMVAELIDPTMPGHKKAGEANVNGNVLTIAYIRNDTHTDTLQSAANAAQVFLGTGMKCASCHNHFLNQEWPQSRFLAFAGMFAPKDLELIRCEKKTEKIIPAKFPFELPEMPDAMPRSVEDRQHRLAELLTDPLNPRFAKTIINRLWKRYLGLGLFEPADDFRLDQPAANPALLDWLADDFRRHGFDLKHTIRLVLTSRTYQLRYDPHREDHFDIAKPAAPRHYRSPALRRLTAEQVIDSVRVATTQTLEPQERAYLDKTSTALTRSLGKPASRNEISTARPDDVAVVQALEMLNGPEYFRAIYFGRIVNEAAEEKDVDRVIELFHRAVLSRAPTSQESALGRQFLQNGFVRATVPSGPRQEIVWLDDTLPEGATVGGTGGEASWKWVTKPEHPVFNGERSHRQGRGPGKMRQHYTQGAWEPMKVGPNDVLFAYVYLDPQNPPRELMLQWHESDWEHRAYWGEDLISLGVPNSPSRRPAGALPKIGEWTRLEVAAKDVGITSDTNLDGVSFDQHSGVVYWDKAGYVKQPQNAKREPLGDLLWALFTSPEFQYLR